ncbi:putative fad dependent oxidoreductase [Echria macrotheca]|uniref:Fad dependent oxidoreductase n=1 Tax=Echria macrotheca TaxID=438768 RepID=A0AAJ0B978_9PEZI|nr:putative fad dependent oxidoreductase [Echria macrotheca]
MDERARIPVTLPRDNPTTSYWQDPPDASIADLRSTPVLPPTADTVIIGSGITGAATAWHLLQLNPLKSQSVVMLEARQACSGATGRNGGHTKAASYRSFPAHAAKYGVEMACQIARLELANILAVHAFARDHSIPCDLNACDTVDVVYDPVQWEEAKVSVAAMREALGEGDPAAEYALYSTDEMREKFYVHDGVFAGKTEKVCGGVGYFAGSISGYLFTVGVLKMCLDRGLNLQTGTPATELVRQQDGKWAINTPRGRIISNRVVLATNGYTAALVPEFQGVLVPFRGQITAHRPGTALPERGCLPTTYSFIYEKGYEYMVPRPKGSKFEGDIIMGGGLVRAPDDELDEFGTTDDTTLNETISKYLRDTTPRYFGPDWGEDDPAGRIRREWTGIMGHSPDGFPFVGEMPGRPGLWVSCSFQGHGMVLCWMSSKGLVEMMEGRDGDELASWFPSVFRVTKERLEQRFQGRL